MILKQQRQSGIRRKLSLISSPLPPRVPSTSSNHWLNELSKSFIINVQNTSSSSYLRCLAYFPLTWPLPSQPGVGQLRRKHTVRTHTTAHKLYSSVVWMMQHEDSIWTRHHVWSLFFACWLWSSARSSVVCGFLAKWRLFGTYGTYSTDQWRRSGLYCRSGLRKIFFYMTLGLHLNPF